MLENILKNDSIKAYWLENNLSDKDFYCRECGKFMLDTKELEEITYDPSMESFRNRFYRGENKRAVYAESNVNIWLVKGKVMSGKAFFRHLCWDCLFKHLGEVEDIPRRARKSSWYRDINNGILRPPNPCQSPSRYFKLIFDITDEELEAEHKKFDTASLESFMRRHGSAEGMKKYEEYRNRQAYTCSREYMMGEKGMTEKEWNDFNANRASTKENFIKRYGIDLGTKKWDEYCELESYAGCKVEYFIEKYGKEKGVEIYLDLNKKKAQTLENFIRKYGDEEGRRRFEESTYKIYSEESEGLFEKIDDLLGECGENSRHGIREMSINLNFDDDTYRVCFLDYTLGKKVIEFNGDYWHANPRFYGPEFVMKHIGENNLRYGGNKAKNIWEYDSKKIRALESLGFKVKTVWERDYMENPDKTIKECLDFLKLED